MGNVETPEIPEEDRYRASAYALLAALLRQVPDRALLAHVAGLSPQGDGEMDEFGAALTELSEAAARVDPSALEEEYNSLFIGLGRGEIVPYGSWYQTGFLMEQPLSDLRDDLHRLGFERSEASSEPEDHVAAIFEVISVMIGDGFSLEQQRSFFTAHLASWLEHFFADLGKARSAGFYQSVARLGAAFVRLESAYLSDESITPKRSGSISPSGGETP